MKEQLVDGYVPFGLEWEKEMMKWKKSDLINFLRKKLIIIKSQYGDSSYPQELCLDDDIFKRHFLKYINDNKEVIMTTIARNIKHEASDTL